MKIYAPSHTLTADIDLQQGAVVHHELGGEHYVRLPFTLPTAVTFPIGSYVNVKGFGRFEVTEENQPKFNAQTGGYDYDLQLDASYMKWKNKLLRYRPLNAKGSETSFRLTATIGTHLNVVTDNLRRLGEADPSFLYDGKEAYVSALKGVADDAKNRHAFIAYEGTDILSALNRIAEAFGCEWWVEDNVICMGRCEMATDTVVLEMHDAIEQMSTQGSKGTYANRLIVFGSERNLPANYREATSPDIVTDGVVQRRLMLPEKDAPKGYIQAPATTEKNAVEAVVVMEDIYPKVECTVKTLTPYVSESYDKEGNKVAETFYRVTDTAFKFTKEMILPDKKLHIVFQSGRMNGMDFEAEYSQENNWFEIVANDTYGRKLPDKDLHPAQDDEFILYNWDSSKAADTGIIEKAEEKLLEAARKQLDKMQKDGTNYECTLSSYWAEKTFRTSAGEYTHYAVGQPVTLKDEARFPQGRKSRIIGYEIKLDIPYDTPRYIVGESPFQSRTERLQQQIDSLTVGGKTYQGTGGSSSGGGQYIYIITQTSQVAPSDTNVFSAARTELDFVHKKKADTIEAGHTFAARQQFQQGADFGSSVTVSGDLLTRGKSTLSGGADFGSTFVEGIAGGRGGRIDANGHAELDSLTLRHFLEVPELRYNRVTVMAGVQWRGAGGGIVKTVFPSNTPNGLLLLKLEKGEIPAVQVGDLCMGIFHSTNEADNETTDADSGTGRFQMKGFGTVYFEVTAVNGNILNYTIRPASDQWAKQLHPKAGMHFAVYGNRTVPERQDSRYSTLQYERFLKGVNDWEFGERNIMAQFGDLSNLTIGGKPMAGYSAYINNLYMSGVIDQFERLDPKLDITSSTGTYIGANERSELLIRLKDGYGTNASADVTHWAVERETGNTTADREWNTLHPNLSYDPSAAGAALSLTSADLGGNDSAVFRFSATYKGKAVTDILVLRRAAKDGQDGADGKDGAPGAPGKDGLNGLNGLPGKNGTSQYLHIKYSANANGNPMTDSVDKYIGMVVTTSPTPPTAYTSYKWSQFKGDNGSNGLNGSDGTPGEDGETYQLHMAYANSEDGKVDFHTADPTMRAYVGTAVTAKSANPDNQDPTDPKAYTWKRVAPVSYTFLRYSNDGGETFTDIDRNNPAYKEEAAKWEGVNLVSAVPSGYKNGWSPWATLANSVNNCVHKFSMRAKELKKGQELVVSYVLEFNNVVITKGHGEDGYAQMQSYGSETGYTGKVDSCMYPSADWTESDFRKFFGLNTETPLNGTFLIQHRRPCSVNSKDERWHTNIRFDYCTGLVRIGRIMCCAAPSTDSYHPAPEIAYRGTQTGRYLGTLTWDKPFPSEDPKDYEWQDTQGFGVAFSWSANDLYTETQLNEWLAVDGTTPRYFSTNVPIGQYPNTRIGDYVSASFRAKDTKNVHTMKGRICDFQLDGGGVPYGIGFIVLSHSVVQKGEPGQDGQDGALGHGVAFSWSKDDHYTEAQLNEFLAVGHQESWSASVAGVKIPAEARVGDFVFASFRAKDLKNVHTYYARLTVIMPNRVDFAAVSLAHSVIPKGETGAQGVEGAIYRKTEWKVGVIHNDGSRVEADGHRYVDIVIRRTPNPAGGTLIGHFLCISYGESSIQDDPANYDKEEEVEVRRKWRKLNETVPTYTPLLLADNASIDFLQGNTIKVTERVGGVDKVVATLGNGEYPLYVGADTYGNAPFRVKRDGHMDSTSGNIGGWDITPEAIASANGSSVLDAVTGNIACSGTLISRPVQITDENFKQYTAGLARYLDLFRTGRVIILTTCHSTPDGGNHAGQMIGSWLNIHFPSAECKKDDQSGQIPTEALNALQYLGNTFYLFNLAEHWVEIPLGGRKREPCSILLTGRFRQKRKDGTTSSTVTTSLTVSRLSSVRLTCVNDGLSTVWEYETDEADSLASTSWNPNIPVIIPGSPSDPDRFDPNATIRPEITPRP